MWVRPFARLLLVAAITLAVTSAVSSRSSALSLSWSSGQKDLTVTSVSVCSLLVRPSGADPFLPPRWTLVYVGYADDGAVSFVEGSSPAGSTAPCAVHPPATSLDQLAHTSTVEFCGPEPGTATECACFLLRLQPSVRIRIAAVQTSGMTPGAAPFAGPDAEVTVNGGAEGDYPPAVWSTEQLPDSAGIARAGILGVGVGAISSVRMQSAAGMVTRARGTSVLESSDSLQILSQSDSWMTVALPAAPVDDRTLILQAGNSGALAASTLSPTEIDSPADYRMTLPSPYKPKDFAFVFGGGFFHLFYIFDDPSVSPDSTERYFGHAVSYDLKNWQQAPSVIPVRSGKFDSDHVWAPTIQASGNSYFMYYTGITNLPFTFGAGQHPWFQRIGVATSQNLIDWTRYDEPVYTGNMSTWAFADSSQFDGEQFRDPFIIPDPANSSKWLMYHVAEPIGVRGQTIVGAARNDVGALGNWANVKPLWNTDAAHFQGWVESPTVFSHNGLWYLMYSNPNSSRNIAFETASDPVADSAAWSGHINLYNQGGAGDSSLSWFAPEFLTVGPHNYLAVVDDQRHAIVIREITWGTPPSFSLGDPSVTGIATVSSSLPQRPRISSASIIRGQQTMLLRLELPSRLAADVEVLDIQGRRLARVAEGVHPAGTSVVSWDGRDGNGNTVQSGVYFARLRTVLGDGVTRIVVLR